MLIEKIETLARKISWGVVREAIDSLRDKPETWKVKGSYASTQKPYPMGVYSDDINLYYARGWGRHVWMHPLERWLVRRLIAALKSQGQNHAD